MSHTVTAPPSMPDGALVYGALVLEFVNGVATAGDLNATERAYLAGFGCAAALEPRKGKPRAPAPSDG